MAETKSKAEKAANESPELQALRERETSLKNTIEKKVPLLPEERQEQAREQFQQHLDGVQAKIKKLSKAT